MWVEVMSFKSGKPTVRVTNLTPLSGRSNKRMGGAPSVRTGLKALPRCKGTGQLMGTWKAAGRAFKINWKILAAITEIESGHGCNMGPSSAGAITTRGRRRRIARASSDRWPTGRRSPS